MNTLICSFDCLHDNRILCYCADFASHTLHIDTQNEYGEKVSIYFSGLFAHWFENMIQDNILFGMDFLNCIKNCWIEPFLMVFLLVAASKN